MILQTALEMTKLNSERRVKLVKGGARSNANCSLLIGGEFECFCTWNIALSVCANLGVS